MKPYATDWVTIHPGVEYSAFHNVYYHKGRVYCELSARHNGIIGIGHKLKEVIKCNNSQEQST